ncbi:MAG: hypothetical protein SH807_02660 [Blastochloris sp.]|jgi:hypothetical protein|nr:hypothetical protein [Blastochloris sp.]
MAHFTKLIDMGEQIKAAEVIIRLYEPKDREALQAICCDTGFLGKAIDQVFGDRELFGNFLTEYYLECEPDLAVVLESEGQVQGYLLGCRYPQRKTQYEIRKAFTRIPKMIFRYLTCYQEHSRKYVNWLFLRGWREVPETPLNMAHMHINLRPGFKNVSGTRAMIETFLKLLADKGETAVYGQMVVFEKRRGPRMFARYGFEVRDAVEVTKYKGLISEPVYLFTVIKNLEKNVSLYGTDLWKDKNSVKSEEV